MAEAASQELGKAPIGKLLVKQAVPASIGILVMSLNILVDTIFVGQWIGVTAIAAINVVLPVSFFIAALGMAIGIGGSSVISRALGSNNLEKALKTFGNQITLTLLFTVILVFFGLLFVNDIVPAFGGKGAILLPAKIYYTIILYGVPLLALSMMGNTVIRAEGKPKFAMYAMLIPSVSNLFLDYVFIYIMEFGMSGAAWATVVSYGLCFGYVLWFFLSENSELNLSKVYFGLQKSILSEIGALGFVTLATQAVVSITYLLINNILFNLGRETSVTAHAIVGRMLMFALFPIYGITQGFLPIVGFNFGANQYIRVKEVIYKAIKYAAGLASLIFVLLMVLPEAITKLFTTNMDMLVKTPTAMRWVFAATPIIALQLIGSAYFQAIGKAKQALPLTLTRQGFFFIPLIFILPNYYGEMGVLLAFPISDVLATIVTAYFLNREIVQHLNSVVNT